MADQGDRLARLAHEGGVAKVELDGLKKELKTLKGGAESNEMERSELRVLLRRQSEVHKESSEVMQLPLTLTITITLTLILNLSEVMLQLEGSLVELRLKIERAHKACSAPSHP